MWASSPTFYKQQCQKQKDEIHSKKFEFRLFHYLMKSGAEKLMQNGESEHRRWLPEAVHAVRRAVNLIYYAQFFKP